jgi:DNA-binding CsgD family transcriptional regulator
METNSITFDKDLYLSLHSQGFRDVEVSEKMNLSLDQLRYYKKKLNIKTKRNSIKNKYEEIITDLVNKGYSDNKISTTLDISSSHVNYIRKKLGLKTNFIERTYTSKEDRLKGYILRNIKSSAKRRNIEFNLKYTDITLPSHCPLLEIPLNYHSYGSHKALGIKKEYNSVGFNDYSRATVDRIDNSKGYVKGNVIIISRIANAMKNEANFEQLTVFCKNILKIIDWYKNQDARGSITDIFFLNKELSLDF